MKRKISAIAVCAATLSFLCACTGKNTIILPDRNDPSSKSDSVSFFGHRTDSASLNVIEDALQSFMSENANVNVSYESASETSYFSALDKRFATRNLDDVFMTDRDRLLSFMNSSALADISSDVNLNYLSEFALSQSAFADGALYAVPTAVSTHGLYVNYGILQNSGISVPKNLSDFAAACDYFKKQGVTPVIVNNYSSLRTLIYAIAFDKTYKSADVSAEISKFNAEATLMCDGLNDGIDFIYRMIGSGWIDLEEAKNCECFSGDIQLFSENGRPFMITGSYAVTSLKRISDGISFGIYPYPVLETGSVLVAQADAILSVKDGERADSAKKLVNKLTQYSVLSQMSEGQGYFSVLKEQTQIQADAALVPSASHFTGGKFVVASDVNLKIPLDSYLNECTDMILNGAKSQEVKDHLYSLLKKEGAK